MPKWIECHDIETSDHAIWIRTDLIQAIRVERPKGGQTWQVYVDAAAGSARFGKLHAERDGADQVARNLLSDLLAA